MSFPNVPNINPNIDITLEDSINLLLISVALEEISLSELISAETRKLESVIKQGKCKDIPVESLLEVNKSIDNTLKNIIKLQMLLQFKLDNVKELIPSTTTTTTTTTTSTTTTTTCSKTTTTKPTTTTSTYTTTCTTTTCSTTTKICCECGIIGEAVGCISNPCDRFYGQMATVKLYAFNDDSINNSVYYYICEKRENYRMSASGNRIIINYPHLSTIVLSGKGWIRIKAKCKPVLINCDFNLTIWLKPNQTSSFRMEIICPDQPKLKHDSGIIINKNNDDESRLIVYS
ncbi:MAG: hypothetical protein PHC69_05270 [Ruminiclostridium sp.]|nr:hypothetical protein [Ruminiclostridium sp.]